MPHAYPTTASPPRGGSFPIAEKENRRKKKVARVRKMLPKMVKMVQFWREGQTGFLCKITK